MKYMLVVVLLIYLIRIQTENINFYPGKENLYSIFTGDTIALQCPVNSSMERPVRCSYMKGRTENLLSIGEKINKNETHYECRIELGLNHLKNVTYLIIYNITTKDQKIVKCYFAIGGDNQSKQPIEYEYNILLANVTQSSIKKQNEEVCCVLHGQNIRSIKFIWEQRTLYVEHIRFSEIVQKNNSGMSERNTDETMHKHNHLTSCLDLNTNGISKYEREGKYICIAQVYLYGRNQTVIKTTSIKIENIQGNNRTEKVEIGDTKQLLLLKRFLGIGYFILPIVILVVTVFCNISIHLYCKKLKKVMLETDVNEISREGIEMGEADHGYHTINEDNFRKEDTGIENQSGITSFVRALDIAEAPLPVSASGSNEQQIEENGYVHPYCTVMQSTIELHEYKDIVPGIVDLDGSDVVLNQELQRLYENQNVELRQYINNR